MIVPYRVRMMVPPEVRVVGSALLPANRAERKQVIRHLVVPSSLPVRERVPGSVWGVAMMHNEGDIVRHVVEHLLAQGIDQLLIADNASTDATSEILHELAVDHPVHVVRDDLEAHFQGPKMTVLSNLARRAGADWVVPFDADELWFAEDGCIADFLRTTDAVVVRATIHDVFPANDDDPNETNPFLRLRHVDTAPFPIVKTAFKTHRLAKVGDGNMDVTRRGPRADGLFIAHYPWRSFEQMAHKLRHGKRAMELTSLSADMGVHWRVGGGWTDDQLRAAWDELCAGHPVDDLSWSPIGRLEPSRPGEWRTWQLPAAA